MKKYTIVSFLLLFIISTFAQNKETENLNKLMNEWHLAATNANGNAFFGFMDSDCIYIGTDETERWKKDEFVKFAKPYFDKGKAWDFKPIERKFYFSKNKKTTWFNETLNTWMGICRSSGVLEKSNGKWKLKHYHLSVTVPNEKIKEFIELVEKQDDPPHQE
ncbi:MAG: nuclear transport factor 2 family protein [Bacteroidota bacterium]